MNITDEKYKNIKLKAIFAGILVFLIIFGIVLIQFDFLNKKVANDLSQISKQDNQDVFIETTPAASSSSVWDLSLTKDEIKALSNLEENNLIYAVKKEYNSIVYKKNLRDGTQTKVIEFKEAKKADKSDNLWEGLPPAIALSSDKKSIAFIDEDGLKTYNLQTKTAKTYIRKVAKGQCEYCPPKWSIDSLNSAFSLARPLWSTNDKYISFLEAQYEGAGFGIIDVETEKYTSLDLMGGYSNLVWSPVKNIYAEASPGGYESSGLHVSLEKDIAKTNNLALKIDEAGEMLFLETNFSPNGEKLVFTFKDPHEKGHLALINTNGTDFLVLVDKINARMPFFSKDGDSVFFLQEKNSKQVLTKFDLIKKEFSDLIILPSEFNYWEKAHWTKDGFLAITGISLSSSLVLGGDSTRMIILDIANKKVIYASQVFNEFANFLGFLN